MLGAAVFAVVNTVLDKYVVQPHPDLEAEQREVLKRASGGAGFALLAAVTLEGIPENTAVGVSLVGTT